MHRKTVLILKWRNKRDPSTVNINRGDTLYSLAGPTFITTKSGQNVSYVDFVEMWARKIEIVG